MRNSEKDPECEKDQYDMDDQMRAIYATKCQHPSPKTNKPFQYIAKEHFDPLPEHVKETVRQQHEFYGPLIRQAQSISSKGPSHHKDPCILPWHALKNYVDKKSLERGVRIQSQSHKKRVPIVMTLP